MDFRDPTAFFRIKGAEDVNPDPESQNLISADLKIDIISWANVKPARTTLDFRVENLLDEELYFPEYGRRRINSLPAGEGRTFYAGVTMGF